MPQATKTNNIRFPADLYDQAEIHAKKNELSINKLVVKALEEYLKKHEKGAK